MVTKIQGQAVVPTSRWIIVRDYREIEVIIVAKCRNYSGWWAYALDATNDLIRIRRASQLLRPASSSPSDAGRHSDAAPADATASSSGRRRFPG